MTPELLRALARESADMARMARWYSLTLTAGGKTWLAASAAQVASELADGHALAAIHLDQAACQLLQEAT